MSLASALRRRSLLRFLSAAAPELSVSAAKSRLKREFDPDAALSILSSVSDSSSSPVSARFALDLTVRRLARSRRFSDIQSLLGSRLSSATDASYLATIILSFGSAGMISQAVETFESADAAAKTVVSFNALLTACIRGRKPRRVRQLFEEMSAKYSIQPDSISYTVLCKSLLQSGKHEDAFKVFDEMKEKGISPSVVTYTVLLEALYKADKIEEADKLWVEMINSGCAPDLPAYNVRIMHSAIHGSPNDVLGLIKMMESDGVKPDTITYNYLMSCYIKEGNMAEAKEVFKGLKDKGCPPNAATYKTLMQTLCVNEEFDTALEVFKESVEHNKIPNFRVLRLLVEGLVKESKVEEAKMVITEVKKKFPEPLLRSWKNVEKELGLVENANATPEEVENDTSFKKVETA